MLLESMVEHLLNLGIHIIFGFLPIFHHVNMNGFVIVGIEFEDIAKEDKNGWLKNLFLFVGKVTKKLPNHQIFVHIFFRTTPSHVTIHNKRNSPHGTFAMRAAIS